MPLGIDDPTGVAFCAHGPVPEGHLRIAQRFSVGFNGKTALVPKGRLKVSKLYSRPFGTHTARLSTPTLKRWAILRCPSGTRHGVPSTRLVESSNPSGIGQECPRAAQTRQQVRPTPVASPIVRAYK